MAAIQTLVACSDLTGYAKFAGKLSDQKVFDLLSHYYEFVGESVASSGGKAIKFMGDAALLLFPESQADEGIRSLLVLQHEGDKFLSERGVPCRHHIRASAVWNLVN